MGRAMQVKLDFSQIKLVDEKKKTELVSFRAGEKFKADLNAIAKSKNVDLSALIFEYALAGYLEDYKNLLLLQANGTKPIRELLK